MQATTVHRGGLLRGRWAAAAALGAFSRLAMSAEDGAVGLLRCMAQPGLASGTFLAPRWVFAGDARPHRPEGLLLDKAQQDMLWAASDKAVFGATAAFASTASTIPAVIVGRQSS
jgi:hypothetical protein